MEKIRCTIEQITFQNAENGYTVYQVKDGDGIYHTVVGTFSDLPIGTTLIVEGDWRNDKRYGRQFIAESWIEEMPSTVIGIEKYLSSGLVKGIGPMMAKRIVEMFGSSTFDVIDNEPNKLLGVQGIGQERLNRILSSWEKQKGVKDVMVFLHGHGVSSAYAIKIYKQYGKDSISKVKENPYCLADDVFGIGFKMADAIAFKLGYEKNDIRRCKSGLVYTLNQLSTQGHCFATKEQLLKTAHELLDADSGVIENALDIMLFDNSLIQDEEAIFLPVYYYSECGVAKKIKSLIAHKGKDFSDNGVDIEKISESTNIEYDEVQVSAILKSLESRVMVLTGGPGTGKTTTTIGIIAALESKGLSILCAAPTGRAAKRMTEATGKLAKTIHRLLEYNPKTGFGRDEHTPLDGDVLIVDESSMIDITLMYSLLKAVPKHMRLILVGDIDQLPSVGAGNVLRDVIDSGVVEVVRLTRIFRQAQASRIVTNAHKINQGKFPDVSNGKDTDFFFIKNEEPEQVCKEIVDIVRNRVPKSLGYRTNDIQVLSPMTKSATGTINLNVALQTAINPVGPYIASGSYKYRVGDRVMQIKNNYDKNVFNGDIGFVSAVDTEERTLSVVFDKNEIEYESGEFGELTLAYATTIHKSQGSEYPVVVIPILMSHFIMLQRNLIYTAVTRAKRLCIVIGAPKALGYAIRNMVVLKRNTMLCERLRSFK